MQRLSIVLLAAVAFTACKPSKQKMLMGKWQAVSMSSPQLDREITDTKNFIDTVGKTTTPDENEILYGVRDMDSLRIFMKEKLAETLAEQEHMIKNTSLDFYGKDEVASNFGSGQDTIGWYIDEDGALILDEMKTKGSGSKITMEIAKLEKDTLQLRFNENGYSSTATFIRGK